MKKILISVKDIKADRYGYIQTYDHVVDATRMMQNILNSDQKNPINTHPQDFQILQIGEYDIESGVVFPCVPHLPICMASDLLETASIE
jgi:uncharacterized protein YbbC (DUF1343 family)